VPERFYQIARRGLATNFTETEIPLDYAQRFRNRFINAAGGAEKRPGYVALSGALPTKGIVTGLHEYIDRDGTATLFASSDGIVFRYNGSSAWTQVWQATTAARLRSVQFDDKLVFFNGVDRQVYIDSATAQFQRLQPVMENGTCGASTSANALTDSAVTDWTAQTFVAPGDIVFNAKRGAYGIVTAVTSSRVSHTAISGAARGFGSTLAPISGVPVGGEPTAGDGYKIYDSIELNVVSYDGVLDNVATIVSTSTSPTQTYISVSADKVANWLSTTMRVGDVVHNTTKTAGSFVSEILSSGFYVAPAIATTSAGDSIVLYQSAMPVASWIHVHYGRAWMIDSRDPRNVVASGANDIQDFTVDSQSLETRTVAIGSQQPGADPARTIASFQTYLIIGTERAVYAYRGTAPADLEPAGLFPQGVVAADGFVNTGNDLSFIGYDGLLSISLLINTNNLQRSNISEPIKNTLRAIIRDVIESPNPQIQIVNYQRRSWIVMKIASKLYIYNYANFVLDDGKIVAGASWSDFDGQIGLQSVLYVRANSDLLLGGADGKVYVFDQNTFTDDGALYPTEYMPGWLNLEEPRQSNRIKTGSYIVPNFQVGGRVVYDIESTGDFNLQSYDLVSVTAQEEIGGRGIGTFRIGTDFVGMARTTEGKIPLRWRGAHFRVSFRTLDQYGPDVLAGFTIYGDIHGRR
jgi:hypothetical protein